MLSIFVAVPQKVLKKTKFNYGFYLFSKDPFLRYKESRTGQQHEMVTGRGKCGKFTKQKCLSVFPFYMCAHSMSSRIIMV